MQSDSVLPEVRLNERYTKSGQAKQDLAYCTLQEPCCLNGLGARKTKGYGEIRHNRNFAECQVIPSHDSDKQRWMIAIMQRYRWVNAVTEDNLYCMPRQDDLLDRIGQANFKWSRKIDFVMSPKICTTIQRLDNLFDRKSNYVIAYIDDVAVFLQSWSEHLQHLETVFELLNQQVLLFNRTSVLLDLIPVCS